MNTEFNINIIFNNGEGRRPAIFGPCFGDFPFLIDYQLIGNIYNLCNTLASHKEKIISLLCIISDKKEDLKDWVELKASENNEYEYAFEYEVHNLDEYTGEKKLGEKNKLYKPYIYSRFFERGLKICPPKYIYLKRTEIKNILIPEWYNHGFGH